MAVSFGRNRRATAFDRVYLSVKRGGDVNDHKGPSDQPPAPPSRGYQNRSAGPIVNTQAMGSISPVSATPALDMNVVVATIQKTIMDGATQSMTDLLASLSTTGTLGRNINALA
jgi:hypothetical protein